MIGQYIGQYRIIDVLGRGGMATVYRAVQTSIEREVAIKIIQTRVTPDDPAYLEFRKRFEREARLSANLSHPHILKVFDFGEHNGDPYLVMELQSGGSLWDLIQSGQLTIERASRLIDQMASALDYAHQQGIIHRDLKPKNILLDGVGNAILSDFGIARLMGGDQTSLTGAGFVMGTPAYMPPEQWSGERVLDRRADVYAFGMMIYEMLAGGLPFPTDSTPRIMYWHMNQLPPSLLLRRKELPAGIDLVVGKALAKDPDQRYGTAGEVAAALRDALHGISPLELTSPIPATKPSASTPVIGSPHAETYITSQTPKSALLGAPADQQTTRPKRNYSKARRLPMTNILIGGAAITIVVLTIAIISISQGNGFLGIGLVPTETPTATFTDTPTYTATATSTPSPTSTYTPSHTPTATNTLDPVVLAGMTLTERALSATPTPSPDTEKTVAAIIAAQETEVATTTTANAIATAAPTLTAQSWTKTFTPTYTPSATVTPSPTETATITPSPTPTETATNTPTSTYTPLPTATPRPTETPVPTQPPPAQIVYTSVESGIDQVWVMNPDGTGHRRLTFSNVEDNWSKWSPDRRSIIFATYRSGSNEIWVMDANGDNVSPLATGANDWDPVYSPDGSQIVFVSERDGNREIYLMDADGTNQRRLTNTRAQDWFPTWTPNGDRIIFQSNRNGNFDIYSMDLNGSDVQQLTTSSSHDQHPDVSPDGQFIVFTSRRNGNDEIYIMDIDGANQRRLTQDSARDQTPVWSPDGQNIAFASTRGGKFAIFRMDVNGQNVVQLTDAAYACYDPAW
ncbi:MAG: hypothetical protein OHK0023_23950 [Anaerolineae bacterium]